MRKAKDLTIFCFFLLLAWTGSAQINTSIAEAYSLQEGLSDRAVSSIVKGRDSLMWIGTANGLNKFDGYNFTVFNSDPDDSLRLLNSNIRQLSTDRNGNLLILYENTTWVFNIFDPLTYELRKVNIDVPSGVKGLIRSIEVDQQGETFVISEIGDSTWLFRFDGDSTFQPVFSLLQRHRVQQNYQVVVRHLSNGDFLINDSVIGLQLLDRNGKVKKYFLAKDLDKQGSAASIPYPNRVSFLHEDKFGQIWLAWENVPGIFNLEFENFTFVRKSEFDQRAYYSAIWEDLPGNLLV
ncbi:MAG: hypothetical protein KDD04_11660, partial [Sinomicrobium sp.]|nr:hypothetical protein [Sinomicrobium sp.]